MIKKYLKKIDSSQQIIICVAVTAILALITWQIDTDKSQESIRPQYDLQTDIPRGYNLYALEVDNFEAINSLVGNYALVNLYQVHKSKRAKLALQQVKLIRSPKDPRHFAVLATNEQLETLTSYPGPFKVALQNPNAPNKSIVQKKLTRKRQITIEEN